MPFAHGYPSAYGAHPIYVWGSSFFFFDFELVGSLKVAILSPYVLHTLTWSSKKSTDWPTTPLAAIHSIENIIIHTITITIATFQHQPPTSTMNINPAAVNAIAMDAAIAQLVPRLPQLADDAAAALYSYKETHKMNCLPRSTCKPWFHVSLAQTGNTLCERA